MSVFFLFLHKNNKTCRVLQVFLDLNNIIINIHISTLGGGVCNIKMIWCSFTSYNSSHSQILFVKSLFK